MIRKPKSAVTVVFLKIIICIKQLYYEIKISIVDEATARGDF